MPDVTLPCEKRERLLRGIRPVIKLDLQIPLLEQPFRYIATIAVGCAPPLQFGRGRVILLREAQTFDEEFKLRRNLGDEWGYVTPIGISASAHNLPGNAEHQMILFPAQRKPKSPNYWKAESSANLCAKVGVISNITSMRFSLAIFFCSPPNLAPSQLGGVAKSPQLHIPPCAA